jgi:hypothetical protein
MLQMIFLYSFLIIIYFYKFFTLNLLKVIKILTTFYLNIFQTQDTF